MAGRIPLKPVILKEDPLTGGVVDERPGPSGKKHGRRQRRNRNRRLLKQQEVLKGFKHELAKQLFGVAADADKWFTKRLIKQETIKPVKQGLGLNNRVKHSKQEPTGQLQCQDAGFVGNRVNSTHQETTESQRGGQLEWSSARKRPMQRAAETHKIQESTVNKGKALLQEMAYSERPRKRVEVDQEKEIYTDNAQLIQRLKAKDKLTNIMKRKLEETSSQSKKTASERKEQDYRMISVTPSRLSGPGPVGSTSVEVQQLESKCDEYQKIIKQNQEDSALLEAQVRKLGRVMHELLDENAGLKQEVRTFEETSRLTITGKGKGTEAKALLQEGLARQYSFKREGVRSSFYKMLADELILPMPKRPEEADLTYCPYHRCLGHEIEDCLAFKDILESSYQKGIVRIPERYLLP